MQNLPLPMARVRLELSSFNEVSSVCIDSQKNSMFVKHNHISKFHEIPYFTINWHSKCQIILKKIKENYILLLLLFTFKPLSKWTFFNTSFIYKYMRENYYFITFSSNFFKRIIFCSFS